MTARILFIEIISPSTIVAWGYRTYPDSYENDNFIAIAAGWLHSLALKSDGTIVGWGDNEYGEATPPDGNNFIAIAAGYDFSLALKSDGSIVGWGDNWLGQATSPVGNDFIAIAAGQTNSLALCRAPVCQFNLAGDLNNDCKVDLEDLNIFTEQWLQPAGPANLDNIDGINFSDYAILAENWLIDCTADPTNPQCVPN